MKTAIVLLVVYLGSVISFRTQSIGIRGRLMCGSKPASNERIKLWEEDSGPDPDDLLDQGYTDENGEFLLKGDTVELTPIDPVFKVYHDCDDGIKPGKRKVKFKIPKSYITEGKTPKKIFDLGTLNLETIFNHVVSCDTYDSCNYRLEGRRTRTNCNVTEYLVYTEKKAEQTLQEINVSY